MVFLFYIGAFLFYLYVRIAKTLNLGIYTFYGVILLVVECMGATTVVVYGINLLFNPVHEQFVDDDRQPGSPRVNSSTLCTSAVLLSLAQYLSYSWVQWQASRIAKLPSQRTAVRILMLWLARVQMTLSHV